ncbi:olfactory receptor 2K2-like [Spea bombifrons]|uniref:olfactory receptor 2K2-like n=1 Tax=Spea bombifrons TaxID=233779 RepID=UPI00234906EC|nr:olfactory receptor 2K2-like [Spea bombifrons]
MHESIKNSTWSRDFQLIAFSRYAGVQVILFLVTLLMFLLATLGNITITALICLTSHLHTPMYFFLCNLSVQDILYVTSILPKLMTITATRDTNISFPGCIAQMFVFVCCVSTEFFLLASMAYDRYVAICIPLRYSLIMNKRACALMATFSWLLGALNSVMYSALISDLSFCKIKEINHLFCDVKTIMSISCSDIKNIRTIMTVEGALWGFVPFILILISYVYIISTILRIRTSAGRLKTFSSCSSHLTVVILFCVTSITLNMKPTLESSQEQDKLLSMLYVALVPMLNPLVYVLRNKEVMKAVNKIYKHICFKSKKGVWPICRLSP